MQNNTGSRIDREEMERHLLTVSHELKAPLTEIAAYARIIEEDYREILPERSEEHTSELQSRE